SPAIVPTSANRKNAGETPALQLSGLKSSSATAAESTARESSSAEARSAAAARSGSQHGTCARRHHVQTGDEHQGMESACVISALIPGWRLRINILECADPFLFHAQSHRERQKFLEG